MWAAGWRVRLVEDHWAGRILLDLPLPEARAVQVEEGHLVDNDAVFVAMLLVFVAM